jgi:zinc and cadmium transporter
MNLVWDMVHNSIDWIIIWSAFIVDVHLWIATSLAVILHEIPQEIWDYCVLVHWWIQRKKALLYNFLTALTAFIWLWIAYLLSAYVEWITQILMPVSAWLFIYIAASDMIPELHKESHIDHSIHQIIFLAIGFVVMYWLTLTEWDEHSEDDNSPTHQEYIADIK